MAEVSINIEVGGAVEVFAYEKPQSEMVESPGGTVAWNDVTGKPESFTPSAHVHAIDDITDLSAQLAAKASLTDLSTAVDALKDGVPGAGDTLQKLYNLILSGDQEYTVDDIAERDALNITGPSRVFVVDDGDGNWAYYRSTTTGVGATFVKLSDPDLLNAVMSAAQIKTAYESNPDTNAFTNALLSKLNGIADGATANATDAALRNRATHTGTQPASSIQDFHSAVLALKLISLAAGNNTPITAGNSILTAFQDLQAQITALLAKTYNIVLLPAGSDTTTTSNTAVSTGFSLAVEANSRYVVKLRLAIGCSGVGGVKMGWNMPAGATLGVVLTGRTSSATAQTMFRGEFTSQTLGAQAYSTDAGSNGAIEQVVQIITGANAGTVTFEFASGTSGQTSTIFSNSSQMEWLKVP